MLGRHEGLAYYTLGQRQGLGVGGTRDGDGAPWFVAGKDASRNALVVVQGHDDPRLYASAIDTGPMYWIGGVPPEPGRKLAAKTRYRMADAPCRLEPIAGGGWRVAFDSPQWAPTPGQYLVVYEADVCLGGGVIETRASALAPQERRHEAGVAGD